MGWLDTLDSWLATPAKPFGRVHSTWYTVPILQGDTPAPWVSPAELQHIQDLLTALIVMCATDTDFLINIGVAHLWQSMLCSAYYRRQQLRCCSCPDAARWQRHNTRRSTKQPKLTAAESDYQGQILQLVAVVHALWWFQHCLLGGGGPQQEDCWTDFNLLIDLDHQAVTWL